MRKWSIATIALIMAAVVGAIWYFRKGALTATAAAANAGVAPAGASSTTAQNLNAATGLVKSVGGLFTGLFGGDSTDPDPSASASI